MQMVFLLHPIENNQESMTNRKNKNKQKKNV